MRGRDLFAFALERHGSILQTTHVWLIDGGRASSGRAARAMARALRHRTAVQEALPNLRNPPIAVKVIPSLPLFRCAC